MASVFCIETVKASFHVVGLGSLRKHWGVCVMHWNGGGKLSFGQLGLFQEALGPSGLRDPCPDFSRYVRVPATCPAGLGPGTHHCTVPAGEGSSP